MQTLSSQVSQLIVQMAQFSSQFLLKCSMIFEQQPYSSDCSQVALVMSLLTGRSSEWASAGCNSSSPVFNAFALFSEELKSVCV